MRPIECCEIAFTWGDEMMVSVKIGCQITITSGDMEDAFRVRGQLIDDYKISFDTGYGAKGYDWFLDWSLQHSDEISREDAVKHIKKRLDEAKLEYDVVVKTYTDD